MMDAAHKAAFVIGREHPELTAGWGTDQVLRAAAIIKEAIEMEKSQFWTEERLHDAQFAHDRNCKLAITNTANRLGLDPVAFAEACQDGELLARALLFASLDAPQGITAKRIKRLKAKGST